MNKICKPVVPSISHLAAVRVAIDFSNNFPIEVIVKAYGNIQDGISTKKLEDNQYYPGCDLAEKKLLRIPPLLRKRVMEVIYGLEREVYRWKIDHSLMKIGDINVTFYLRNDGTVNYVETARHIVFNQNIHVHTRFILACNYCFKETILALLVEMQATGQVENFESRDSMVCFWIKYLSGGFENDWEQAFEKCFLFSPIRFRFLFPSMRPEERAMILLDLSHTNYDDLRCCLFVMTREEEERFIKRWPISVLNCFWHFPQRSVYMETIEKIIKILDYSNFENVLDYLLGYGLKRSEYDLNYFECVWNCSPSHLKESINDLQDLRENVEKCLNEIRERNATNYDYLRNYQNPT